MIIVEQGNSFYIEDFPYNMYSEGLYTFLKAFRAEGEVFIFSFMEDYFDSMDEEYKLFLEERTVFHSDEWVSYVPSYGRQIRYRWFVVPDREDMKIAIQKDYWFMCAVLKPGEELSEASFIIEMLDREGPRLRFTEKRNKGDFLQRVLPQLLQIVKKEIVVVSDKK